ncbi:MAG: cytosine deaminase [Oscillatoriophycideae cyanobacterium NC_groundwater_1537_Pr4_S-0.65um_50_18]|nr:cytosine deaminase [Oscillatoriophycideae cyanobacterium NC_groundwater_1537_Pr4_S-0.65um_50_18]
MPHSIPASVRWIKNAHIPVALLSQPDATIAAQQTFEGLSCVDIEIREGTIAQIVPANSLPEMLGETIDLRKGLVFPCFVDMHTHLDKGHTWGRSPNLEGTFDNALTTVQDDRQKNWHLEDVYRRMEFGLKCSYAHGTQAIRTHIDALDGQAAVSLEAVKKLQAEWQGRLILQAVSLVPLDVFLTPEGEKFADQFAAAGGVLGGLVLMNENLDQQLDRVFALASERGLNLDFHTDESGDPQDITLRHVAAAAVRHQFAGQVVCGHCCSLSVQPPDEVRKTLDWVKQAGIGIVSLPMCNLYLQDRNQQSSQYFAQTRSGSAALTPDAMPTHTPRWRGITLLHELKHSGIPVAVASDNCRDPFYGFGDHDMLEVLTQSTRIAHFDAPYGDWCRTVTETPAELMGLSGIGQIGVGLPADLVLFKARYYSELLARFQSDRTVLRQGKAIDQTLPDYADLDDLVQNPG